MNYLIQYALSFVGTNYLWGGSNPLSGFDCSGLVDEIMESVGLGIQLKPNAQGIYNYHLIHGIRTTFEAGSLVFYGRNNKEVSHVAFMIDEKRIVEAGHGDSSTVSKEAAGIRGAFVRIRPYNYRSDLVGVLHPNYPDWVVRS